MEHPFQIRAVQLDLARQMETIEFIKKFIEFIAANHYNTLFLYLEWRIQTKCVDLGESERYTREEIKEIIQYAAQHGIDVIPGIATLGHADLLLKKEQFKHLSELRDGSRGRFSACQGPDVDLCPSRAAVKQLLTDYLMEVSEIFNTSKYLHIGADEVHNIGYCSDCGRKVTNYAAEQKLYLDHILFVYSIVKKLGKNMMMWDDMFEFYSDILEKMPRDITMVNWIYRENVPCSYGHFFNQRFEDWLGRYYRLGFPYLIAPADFIANNTSSFTEYAENHHPVGGLLTSWEKAASLMYKSYPAIALSGQLWSGKMQNIQQAMNCGLKQIFGIEDKTFFHAVEAYANQADFFPSVSLTDLTVFDFNGPDYIHFHSLQTVASLLQQYKGKVNGYLAETVLQDILFDCQFKLLKIRCQIACWKYFKSLAHESFDQLKEELQTLGDAYLPYYKQYRPASSADCVELRLKNWFFALEEVLSSGKRGRLTVLLAQPDYYTAAWTRVFINEKEIACQCYKCNGKPFYEVNLFIPADEALHKIRVEVVGFGGQGIAYVSGKTANGNYAPSGVIASSGVVEHAEMALTNDVNYAFLGLHDIESAYRDRSQGTMTSSITLTMRKTD